MSDDQAIPLSLERLGRALLEGEAEAVVYADRAGRIRYWNAAATRLFGHDAAAALGQSLDLIIPVSLRARHWDGYAQMMTSGHSRHRPAEILAVPALHRDGSRLSVQFTVTALRDAQGHIEGVLAVLRDVSEQYATLQALRHELAARNAPPNGD